MRSKEAGRARIVRTVGQRLLIRAIRNESATLDGRTQREIAALIEASEQSLWAWKAGTRRPGALMTMRLEKLFGIPASAWLTAAERKTFGRGRSAA